MPSPASVARLRILWPLCIALLVVAGLCACAAPIRNPALTVSALPPASPASAPAQAQDSAPLILVSIDGFHPDYLARGRTPTLQRLATEGTRARWLTPPFPSLTFPSHYTMVTGLDPDQHGIVNNTMYDATLDASFRLTDRAAVGDGRWWGGVPIWVSLARAGQRSAATFWPGSEAEIAGHRPDVWLPFDGRMLPGERVDRLLALLDEPAATRPRFFTLYFEMVGSAGHAHGPDSKAVDSALAAVDRALARLLAGLRARGLEDTVNLVLVSDHGMASRSPRRVVRLDRVVDLGDVQVSTWGALAGITPRAGSEAAVAAALLRPHRRMDCWRKQDLPARFRFGSHPRVPPILCLANAGWSIVDSAYLASNPNALVGGSHGYDNQHPSMRALFIAYGPAFRRGAVVEPLEARDVYGVLMAALGLEPEVPLHQPRRIAEVLASEPQPIP
jgi:predicted AlkP superfamily pyrophosphatase or phosphodiesterase